jgi:hypothetical protein
LHVPTTLVDEAYGILKRDGLRSNERGVFTKGVSSSGNDRVSARLRLHLRESETDRAHGEDRWLCDLREGQRVGWALKADLREGESQGLVGLGEELLGDVVLLKELTPHTYLLRPLSRK